MSNNKLLDMQSLFKAKIEESQNDFWEVAGLAPGEYDSQAQAYDKLISNPIYNKIMWGNSPKDYADFAKESLGERDHGTAVDIGCGTLSFTSNVYANHSGKNLILSDMSIEMLNIAKSNLETKNPNSRVHFLRADAFNLPLADGTISNILSFGIFHIFEKREELLA